MIRTKQELITLQRKKRVIAYIKGGLMIAVAITLNIFLGSHLYRSGDPSDFFSLLVFTSVLILPSLYGAVQIFIYDTRDTNECSDVEYKELAWRLSKDRHLVDILKEVRTTQGVLTYDYYDWLLELGNKKDQKPQRIVLQS